MTVLAPDDPRHGTVNGYGNLGCRCSECRKAQAAKQFEYMHRTGRTKMTWAEYVAATTRHGCARYRHGGCRCDVCREAMRVEKKRQRERNPEFVARENAARMRRYYAKKAA